MIDVDAGRQLQSSEGVYSWQEFDTPMRPGVAVADPGRCSQYQIVGCAGDVRFEPVNQRMEDAR